MKLKTKENLSMMGKILVAFCYILPIVLALTFSVQTNREIAMPPLHLFTNNPTIQNYINVITTLPVLTYLKNSLIMVAIIVPLQMIIASTSAFAFSFYDFPGKNFLFTVFLVTMMIPGEVTLISNYTTIQNMGLYDTYAGMTITSIMNTGTVFMLRPHMLSLPKELWEAAEMDGCKPTKYFTKVVFPLSMPVVSAKAITAFIGAYNAYFWPMLVTASEEKHTIQIGMAQLSLLNDVNYGDVLAGAILCMIIPLIAFVFGQEKIVQGMTAGAVKS